MTAISEQRNPYKGTPERAWVRVRLLGVGGAGQDLDFLADTGNPCAIIVGMQTLTSLSLIPGSNLQTNFGMLQGGWLRVLIPEIAFDQIVLGYGSDSVVAAAKASSRDFGGLLGLPLLRLMQFAGDAGSFWVRPVAGNP